MAWRSLDTAGLGASVDDQVKFAGGASFTFDWRVSDSIWVRIPQPAIVSSKFGNEWQTDLRVSAGIVIRAGELVQ